MENEKVLILGDSIARHYFPYLESKLLEKEIEAVIPEKFVSCQWKQQRYIDGAFVMKRCYNGRKLKAKTVHFNFGLHSIKLPSKGHDPDVQRAPEKSFEIYEEELIKHIEVLRSYGRHVLFSNTTPNPKNAGMRKDEDVVILNEIAKRVMEKYDVPHNDLYGFVKAQEDYPRLYLHPRAENNCHFDELGRKLLGENIANFILENFVGNE